MMHRLGLTIGLAVSLVALGGCSEDGKPAASPTTTAPKPSAVVEVKELKFTPGTVTVKAGETVEWRFNDGGTGHQVRGATFGSETQESGSYRHAFEEPGTSTYQCAIHPEDMKGIVVVQ